MSQLGPFRPEGEGRASITPQSFRGKWTVDGPSARKTEFVHRKMSNFLHTVANEPTVGLYHVQEHIRRSVPKLVDMKKDLQKTNQRLEDVNGASDYSLETIKLLQDMSTLGSICRSLEESIARTEQIMAGVPYTESTLSQGPMMTTAAVVASQRVEGATAAASPVSAVVDSGFAIKQF